jgi:putative hydroxymethylpyrimidine transport system permease protein
MRRILLPVGAFVAILGIWELLAQTGVLADVLGVREQVSDALVPAPSDVVVSLWEDRSTLAENGIVSLGAILAGFGIAVVLGVAFAVVLHLSDTLRDAFYPLLVASQTIPIVALAPVLVIWLGFGVGPSLAVVAFWGFFPITVNTIDGLRSVDPAAIRMMRTLDAGRGALLKRLEFPAALPKFFTGAKIAAIVAVVGVTFGELVGSNEGLGRLISTAQTNLDTAQVFAAVVWLSAFALSLFGLLEYLERKLAPWGGKELR